MRFILKILLVLALFLLFASLWGFYSSVRPPKIISDITPKDLGLHYEDITFTTGDGITIAGWFIPSIVEGFLPRQIEKVRPSPRATPVLRSSPATEDGEDTVKTIILLHGYPADKGDILPALSFLAEKYNLLLFDFRYLGQSGGSYSTVGAKEIVDLTAAIQYLKTRGSIALVQQSSPQVTTSGTIEVGVWGLSMGGAVALMAASQAPEIKAVVSESSYARLDLMANELYRIPFLKYPLAYLTGVWAKIFLGIDLKKVSPAESAEKLQIPILLIHGINDEVIPFRHAELLQAALKNNPKAEFWFSAKGGSASGGEVHGQFGAEYQKRIGDFFERNLW